MNSTKRFNTRKLVMLALFCAIAYVVMLIIHIKVSFLTFDAKDAVITIAAMIFGPQWGLIISFTVATIEAITVSDTAFYGWIMNFASSAAFSVVASSIYRHYRKMWASVLGLVSAVLAMTAVMMILNLTITPAFMTQMMGSTITSVDVAKMIPTLLLPFNLTKAVINAALVMILYKPISVALKKARVFPAEEKVEGGYKFSWRSVTVTIISVAVIALSLIVMLVLLDGSFSWT